MTFNFDKSLIYVTIQEPNKCNIDSLNRIMITSYHP